jgi:hypothetical protein
MKKKMNVQISVVYVNPTTPEQRARFDSRWERLVRFFARRTV